MDLTFGNFMGQVFQNPALLVITILILGVILVNGWTDAPNAIATCVSTRSISPKKASWKDSSILMSLEKPLTLKYIDAEVFNKQQENSAVDI